MKTVTNSDINTLAAAVPSPYGPLTRVTDFEAFPEPNSGIRGEFTSNLGVTVSFSAEELENDELTLKLNKQYHSTPGIFTPIVADMVTAVAELYAITSGLSTPHTYEDYVAIQEFVTERFPWSRGMIMGNG